VNVDMDDELVKDAYAKAPLLIQACRYDHEHNAIACYEKRYGVILVERQSDVHTLRETDTPLNTSTAFLGDPLEVVTALEEVAEWLADEEQEGAA